MNAAKPQLQPVHEADSGHAAPVLTVIEGGGEGPLGPEESLILAHAIALQTPARELRPSEMMIGSTNKPSNLAHATLDCLKLLGSVDIDDTRKKDIELLVKPLIVGGAKKLVKGMINAMEVETPADRESKLLASSGLRKINSLSGRQLKVDTPNPKPKPESLDNDPRRAQVDKLMAKLGDKSIGSSQKSHELSKLLRPNIAGRPEELVDSDFLKATSVLPVEDRSAVVGKALERARLTAINGFAGFDNETMLANYGEWADSIPKIVREIPELRVAMLDQMKFINQMILLTFDNPVQGNEYAVGLSQSACEFCVDNFVRAETEEEKADILYQAMTLTQVLEELPNGATNEAKRQLRDMTVAVHTKTVVIERWGSKALTEVERTKYALFSAVSTLKTQMQE